MLKTCGSLEAEWHLDVADSGRKPCWVQAGTARAVIAPQPARTCRPAQHLAHVHSQPCRRTDRQIDLLFPQASSCSEADQSPAMPGWMLLPKSAASANHIAASLYFWETLISIWVIQDVGPPPVFSLSFFFRWKDISFQRSELCKLENVTQCPPPDLAEQLTGVEPALLQPHRVCGADGKGRDGQLITPPQKYTRVILSALRGQRGPWIQLCGKNPTPVFKIHSNDRWAKAFGFWNEVQPGGLSCSGQEEEPCPKVPFLTFQTFHFITTLLLN